MTLNQAKRRTKQVLGFLFSKPIGIVIFKGRPAAPAFINLLDQFLSHTKFYLFIDMSELPRRRNRVKQKDIL